MNPIVTGRNTLKIQARLFHGDEIAFGPGKAELLLAIADTGSISAAAKKMDMSYRRAWLLVDTMNRCFRSPLVSSAAGGAQGGGAVLTEKGLKVLQQYHKLQKELETLSHKHLEAMESELKR